MSIILRIFDFDKTISIEHTMHNPALYHPESNTKSGLQKTVVHNDQEICAIATFHRDPEYVLSYLLPVLGLTENDITRCELESFTDHQLTNVYLKNCKYPLIISTPLTDDYKAHLLGLAWSGKNTQIRDIISQLPPCDEYHFYDDTEKNYSTATLMDTLHCYWVEEDNVEFKISKTSKPTAMGALKNRLQVYLEQHRVKEAEEERLSQSLQALSLFASSSDNKNNHNQQKEENVSVATSSLTEHLQIRAATALLKFLDFGPALGNTELEQLQEGMLALILSDWERDSEHSLMDFINNLVKQRAEVAVDDYLSDDDHYETVPGFKN
ncbi:Uncharacterised protein [Legionella donaldsonii]|uniref:Uncharacterized protein n=1 Tax=Legionella donaldsonii TaxID=45060 RepID=A0A378IZ12_9GAMM|nr:hypothetical protein [Legionella donaldsonii]STX40348.1 Uncharacterised protein [Legionella donaldsonii]